MAASRRVSSPTLIGRREESAQLRSALGRITSGEPQVVVIGGESGVGKTRLLEEAVAELADSVRVLRGHCLVFGAELPYLPFAEIIRELAHELGPSEAQAMLAPSGPELAQLVPEVAAAVGSRVTHTGGGSELQRLRLFEALLLLTERIAADRPTVFIFEDLQWADLASLRLLAFLSQSIRRSDIVLIVTVRTEALEAASPVLHFLAELERGPNVLRIELERLDREATRRQIAAILEGGASGALATRVWELGDGNPLFTEELVAAGVGGTDLGSPRLRDLIGARIARLPENARKVLRTAAVLGRSIDPAMLAAASVLDREEIDRAMESGLDEHVLVRASERDASFRFRHELVRSVLAEQLAAPEARAIHTACADALEARGGAEPSEMAYHRDAAGETDAALRWHTTAGFSAEARSAFAAALGHYERVLALWPEATDSEALAGTTRLRIMQRASTAAARAGEHERAIELARAFLDQGPGESDLTELVRSSLRWFLWEAGRLDEALAEARAAVVRANDQTSGLWRANATAHLAGLLLVHDEIAEARSRAEEALRLARAANATEEVVLASGIIGGCRLLEGDIDGGIDGIAAALDAARRIEEEDAESRRERLDDQRYPVGVVLASTQLAAAYEMADRPQDAIRVAEAGYARAVEQGVARTYGATLRATTSRGLYRAGRWDEAMEVIETSLRDGASGSGRVGLLAIGALIHAARGEDDEADEALRLAAGDAQANAVAEAIHWLAVARAERLIWAGHPLEAVGSIAGARERGREAARGAGLGQAVGLDASLPQLLTLAARAGADLALIERASGTEGTASRLALERVRREIDDVRRRPGLARSWAADLALAEAELARAHRGHGPAARAGWQRASEAAQGRPYVEAYARWRSASALLGDRRQTDEAARELERAVSLAQPLGAHRLLEAITELAARAGIGRDADERSRERPFGLTGRELEVLGLLAAGLGNSDIAERLFISPKTASVHVSNIYGKLGVESRVAAATVAHELGLETEPDEGQRTGE